MRLWSLHPSYLDGKGLVALWREALLARKVLQGQTRGYLHHPQLLRFRAQADPISAIDNYLREIYAESFRRGYHFDEHNLGQIHQIGKIPVTTGQLDYELKHLARKLKQRNPTCFRKLMLVKTPQVHPVFQVVPGGIESWERPS